MNRTITLLLLVLVWAMPAGCISRAPEGPPGEVFAKVDILMRG